MPTETHGTRSGREFSVIYVNYQSVHLVSRSIISVRRLLPDCEIIIVNNDPTERRATEGLARLVGGVCLQSETNHGFGAGCNLGARAATRAELIFLNPDTWLREFPFEAAGDSDVRTIIGAVLVDSGGREERQPYMGRRPTILRIILGKILPRFAVATSPVQWVSGAAFRLRRSEFLRIGGFDERFFLYFEDIDFCLHYLAAGGAVRRESGFIVVHGRSGSQEGAWRCQKKCYYASQSTFFERHGPRFDHYVLAGIRTLLGK